MVDLTQYTTIDPAFLTHFNYIEFICIEAKDLKITATQDIKNKFSESSLLNSKVRLSALTMENLTKEMAMIEEIRDYSIVCSSWIPVKSYYLFFNLFLILEYLLCGNEDVLKHETHTGLLKRLKDKFEKKELLFSKESLNKIYSVDEINKWKFESGNNLRTVWQKDRDKQLIRKLLNYTKEEFRRKTKTSISGRNKIQFNKLTKVSLIEFFYWYRIKVNYRDLEFLDSKINVGLFYEYYKNYYFASKRFFIALTTEINRLAKIRLNKVLF